MNILNRISSTSADSVFIETDNTQKISTMKELINKGTVLEIQKFFFATGDTRDYDIHKLTNTQINRHQYALNHRNKSLLRSLLKSNEDGELDSTDLKILHETAPSSPDTHEDIHQYLTFHEEIDFTDMKQRK